MANPDPLAGRDLAAFAAAVETGSVQEAASALNLTQSAATKRIQSLERALGTALLTRSRRGVVPTEAGRALYPHAKEALAALARAEQTVRELGAGRERLLAIAASHTIGGFVLPGWLAAFRVIEPAVQPEVAVLNSPGVVGAVAGKAAEIGFVEGDDDLSQFDSHVVGSDEIVVVVAAGHRWARRRAVRQDELVSEPFYAREAGSGLLSIASRQLGAHGVTLEPSLHMASTPSLKRAVLNGGFTLLSRRSVEDEFAAGRLAAIPVAGVDLWRDFVAIRRRDEPPPRAAAAFWRWLRSRGQNDDLRT
jgi:DNA-binding transcriptional LysR family regulator